LGYKFTSGQSPHKPVEESAAAIGCVHSAAAAE